ncbi:MAG: ASCH domain-containing protein [Erysipelotrichales bacterium]|nr:ASCH domain-containing protein [Erysipelotrichales bacterium]
MKHIMHLDNRPFNLIKEGIKTIELRLYDEKRRQFKERDIIEIINRNTTEKILVEIEKLYVFDNFKELYNELDEDLIVYNIKEMEEFYSKEEQSELGVIGIKIKRI